MNGKARPKPFSRIIIALDIEGSTTRTNSVKADLRTAMYHMLEAALLKCGITEELREPFNDRGDGVITLAHADGVPKTVLLDTFVPTLREMLTEHAAIHPDRKFRLRVAIHFGEVHFDDQGVFGEDIDITCRLLDAPKLKHHLRQTEALLVLVVSEYIHRMVRHDYDGIDGRTFEPIIEVAVGNQQHVGWVQS